MLSSGSLTGWLHFDYPKYKYNRYNYFNHYNYCVVILNPINTRVCKFHSSCYRPTYPLEFRYIQPIDHVTAWLMQLYVFNIDHTWWDALNSWSFLYVLYVFVFIYNLSSFGLMIVGLLFIMYITFLWFITWSEHTHIHDFITMMCTASLDQFDWCTASLDQFDCVTDAEIIIIISGMHKITCSSEPFPIRLLMSRLHAIIHILPHIVHVNSCLTTGDFPFLVNLLLGYLWLRSLRIQVLITWCLKIIDLYQPTSKVRSFIFVCWIVFSRLTSQY